MADEVRDEGLLKKRKHRTIHLVLGFSLRWSEDEMENYSEDDEVMATKKLKTSSSPHAPRSRSQTTWNTRPPKGSTVTLESVLRDKPRPPLHSQIKTHFSRDYQRRIKTSYTQYCLVPSTVIILT